MEFLHAISYPAGPVLVPLRCCSEVLPVEHQSLKEVTEIALLSPDMGTYDSFFFIRFNSVSESFDSDASHDSQSLSRIDSNQLTTRNAFLEFNSNRHMTQMAFQNFDSNRHMTQKAFQGFLSNQLTIQKAFHNLDSNGLMTKKNVWNIDSN